MGIDIVGWLQGNPDAEQRSRKMSEPNRGFQLGHNRVRRSSAKDVEEAMAGGLNKADIYMPPIWARRALIMYNYLYTLYIYTYFVIFLIHPRLQYQNYIYVISGLIIENFERNLYNSFCEKI